MKCLSIRQPWASLIVAGMKDVENRSWATKYRGPVLIHAAATVADTSPHYLSGGVLVRLVEEMA
ncbi:MAG: ASCH domain-containing protein [Deltaproteobacteria bacterium]|nr:ASCH domain-containing protein [Deltaproteobacteria bacterium]